MLKKCTHPPVQREGVSSCRRREMSRVGVARKLHRGRAAHPHAEKQGRQERPAEINRSPRSKRNEGTKDTKAKTKPGVHCTAEHRTPLEKLASVAQLVQELASRSHTQPNWNRSMIPTRENRSRPQTGIGHGSMIQNSALYKTSSAPPAKKCLDADTHPFLVNEKTVMLSNTMNRNTSSCRTRRQVSYLNKRKRRLLQQKDTSCCC